MEFQYQLFDNLKDDEYLRLKDSIRERGVLVPIEIDENGEILDGHHRLRAWQELRKEGVSVPDYQRIIRKFENEKQKHNHIRTLNLIRRHLTVDQMKPHWEEMREEMTLKQIADASGVSPQTVMRALDNPTIPNGKVEGKDGKARPKKYKPRKPKAAQVSIFASSGEQEKRATEAAQTIEDTNGKVLDTKRASRVAREIELDNKRQENPNPQYVAPDLQVLFGDFRDISKDIPDNSIDLIFTDPPYPSEYLPLWKDLSEIASRILKPGKLLIAYSGQVHLPEVMKLLSTNLEYVWMGSLNLSGPTYHEQSKKIYSNWKPLLFYSKGEYVPETWFNDIMDSSGKTKEHHDWEQNIDTALYYIEMLTKQGEKIFEPFLGGGTTALAANQLARSFIGCDNDQAAVVTTINRIKDDAGRSL